MTERLLLVSTRGTNLLTHGATGDDRARLTTVANAVSDAARLTLIVEERLNRLNTADAPTRRKMSAEFSGIGSVLDRYVPSQLFHLPVRLTSHLP